MSGFVTPVCMLLTTGGGHTHIEPNEAKLGSGFWNEALSSALEYVGLWIVVSDGS